MRKQVLATDRQAKVEVVNETFCLEIVFNYKSTEDDPEHLIHGVKSVLGSFGKQFTVSVRSGEAFKSYPEEVD